MKSGMIFEQCVVGGVSSLRDLSTMGWGVGLLPDAG
jgi:hypothetical protein